MKKYSLWDKILINFFGSKFIEFKTVEKHGGKTTFANPVYAFNCPFHGIVESTPRASNGRLICPQCINSKDEH